MYLRQKSHPVYFCVGCLRCAEKMLISSYSAVRSTPPPRDFERSQHTEPERQSFSFFFDNGFLSLRIQPPLRAPVACRVRKGETNTASGRSAERRLYSQATAFCSLQLTRCNFLYLNSILLQATQEILTLTLLQQCCIFSCSTWNLARLS